MRIVIVGATRTPMLFRQGTRDALAGLGLLHPLCEELGVRATLRTIQDADHSFHGPARSGRTDAQARAEVLDALCAWMDGLPRREGGADD